jgi:hypothetical protein
VHAPLDLGGVGLVETVCADEAEGGEVAATHMSAWKNRRRDEKVVEGPYMANAVYMARWSDRHSVFRRRRPRGSRGFENHLLK